MTALLLSLKGDDVKHSALCLCLFILHYLAGCFQPQHRHEDTELIFIPNIPILSCLGESWLMCPKRHDVYNFDMTNQIIYVCLTVKEDWIGEIYFAVRVSVHNDDSHWSIKWDRLQWVAMDTGSSLSPISTTSAYQMKSCQVDLWESAHPGRSDWELRSTHHCPWHPSW